MGLKMNEPGGVEPALRTPASWSFTGRLGWAGPARSHDDATHRAGAFLGYHAGILLFSSMLFLTGSRKITAVRAHVHYWHVLVFVGVILLVNLARRARRSEP